MAADPARGQEYAERPREGEQWREMIERQRREGTNQGDGQRELFRSLPREQQQDKGRGEVIHLEPLLADTSPQSYEEMLRAASQRASPGPEYGLDR
jgi:hypothetical protein